MTTNGPLAGRPYFIRLSKTGDPNAAISYNVGNGGPTLDQRAVIDAGFLELVRLGELPANDPDVARVAAGRRRDDQVDDAERAGLAPLQRRRLRRPRERRPAVGAERPGHRPPLAGALGRARRARARDRRRRRRRVAARGHERVRVRRRPDPRAGLGAAGPRRRRRSAPIRRSRRSASRTAARPARRRRSRGRPRRSCGSRPTSTPGATSSLPAVTHVALRRAHAGHDDADGDEPGRQRRRSPARRSRSPARPRPGTRSTSRRRTPTRTRRRRWPRRPPPADGSFSVAVAGHGRHDRAQRRRGQPDRRHRAREAHGRLRLRAGHAAARRGRPGRRRQRPGQLRLPDRRATSSRARSTSSASRSSTPAPTSSSGVQTRDLTPTFGSPLGAQLVDVYVHVPGAATTSTAAANAAAQLHDRARVRVEPADPGAGLRPALRRRDGRDARHGHDHGERDLALHHVQRPEGVARRSPARAGASPSCSPARTASARTRRAASSRRRRTFQFGVCATASADPHCTFDPGTVPKAIDVITPAGVIQSTELDYTLGPVVLQGVTIP